MAICHLLVQTRCATYWDGLEVFTQLFLDLNQIKRATILRDDSLLGLDWNQDHCSRQSTSDAMTLVALRANT